MPKFFNTTLTALSFELTDGTSTGVAPKRSIELAAEVASSASVLRLVAQGFLVRQDAEGVGAPMLTSSKSEAVKSAPEPVVVAPVVAPAPVVVAAAPVVVPAPVAAPVVAAPEPVVLKDQGKKSLKDFRPVLPKPEPKPVPVPEVKEAPVAETIAPAPTSTPDSK